MDLLHRWRSEGGSSAPASVALTGRVLFTPGDAAYAALEAGGITPVAVPLPLPEEPLPEVLSNATVVVVAGSPFSARQIAQLRRCRMIASPYVGYDHIAVEAATEHGILVANNPDGVSDEVANHTAALIMTLNRKLFAMDAWTRSGAWRQREGRPFQTIHRPSALTLGLVGLGAIGRLAAERVRPLGFTLLVADPLVSAETARSVGGMLVPLDELLRRSDIVSLHVPLSAQTHGLIGAAQLGAMKRGAILINTCRGSVVQEAALIDALECGWLSAAGLDVFEEEPLSPNSPLLRMPNVILTPHAANLSVEGHNEQRRRAGEIALGAALGRLPERRVVINRDLYDRLARVLPSTA